MPRDREKVRRGLQQAALELYRRQGFDETTTAQIAAHAGVTERTFFRHFPDKREVLFDGEAALSAILSDAIREAPSGIGPWETLLYAFSRAEPLLDANRRAAEARRDAIAASSSLQEREAAKMRALTNTLAMALHERSTQEAQASLLAQIGVAVFGQAWTRWLGDGSRTLEVHLAEVTREARHALS